MEYPNNKQSVRPSKRFLVRGGMATLIIAIILIAQTSWFVDLLTKKPKPAVVAPENITLGQLIGKDSNSNGIADWEEKLWGLDPLVTYTNGISNKQIIEEKKRNLGITDSDQVPENETDLLAKKLFTITSALNQGDQNSIDNLKSIGADLAKSTKFKQITNHYSLKSVLTSKTTTASLVSYYNAMSKISSTYKDESVDIEPLLSALETGDTSRLPELSKTKVDYINFSKQLQKIVTPVGIAEYHLSLMNGFYGMAESFDYLGQIEDNGVYAVEGISAYRSYATVVDQALSDLRDYFIQYGILNE